MMNRAGGRTAESISLSAVSKRRTRALGMAARLTGALISLSVISGCATRADLEQLRRSHFQVRKVVADQTVVIRDLRQRLEILQASLEDGSEGVSPDRRASVERRIALLEQRLGLSAPASPDPGVGGPTELAPVDPAVPPAVAAFPVAQPGDGLPPVAPPAVEREVDPAAEPAPVVADTAPVAAPPVAPQARPGFEEELSAMIAREEAEIEGQHVDSDYRTALGMVRDGQCKDAIPRLRGFVRKNIKSPHADNAQYWIGRCFHTQGDHNRAIMELYDVLLKFPKSERVPGALLILADAFADSGDDIDARLTLKKLLSDHPDAPEVAAAQKRLQTLGE